MVTISLAFKKIVKTPYVLNIERLIGIVTNGPYCHVELVLPEGDGYVQWSAIHEANIVRVKRHLHNPTVYDYKDIEITEEQLTTILIFLKSIQGARYDLLGIFGFILPIQDRTDKWFCSEISSNCLKIIGYEGMMILEPSRVSPNKLAIVVGLLKY